MTRYARHLRRDTLADRVLDKVRSRDSRAAIIARAHEMVHAGELHVTLSLRSTALWIAGDVATHARLRYQASGIAESLGAAVLLLHGATGLVRYRAGA